MFGGGITVLCKWPIEYSAFVRYSLNGKVQRLHHGEVTASAFPQRSLFWLFQGTTRFTCDLLL